MLPRPVDRFSADIIIVGAGVAGVTAAAVLSRQGRRVLLLDARATCPPVFKSEKIEHEGLCLLRKFGLVEALLAKSCRNSDVYVAYDGRVFKHKRLEHLGIPYSDLVDSLRDNLPQEVGTKLGHVECISPGVGATSVQLATGENLTARLVVLACGIGSQLLSSLGLRRRMIQKEQCVGLGFDVIAAGSRPFPFQSLTYYSNSSTGIDYLTIFRTRRGMRANLFAFLPANDPWIRAFHQEPNVLLHRAFPKLHRVIGDYHITGNLASGRADLYRTEGQISEGVVLIGDALQTTCPSTGLGIKKALTDVDVLAERVPQWFSTPGMGADKLKQFYEHPRKQFFEGHALRRALLQRRAATSNSLRWRLYRASLHLRRSLSRSIQLSPYLQAQPRELRTRSIPVLERLGPQE